MKTIPTLLLASGFAALLTACNDDPSSAVSGAPPDISHPLGPMPGPADAELEMGEPRQNPFAGDRVAIEEGRDLFVAFNCYGCHGGRGGGGMAPALRDVDWLYGGTGPDIFSSIAQGRPHAMPAWGITLPSDVIWKLTAYIQSMNTDLEPDKPRERQQQ